MKLSTAQKINKWIKIHDKLLKKYWVNNPKASTLMHKILDYLDYLEKYKL